MTALQVARSSATNDVCALLEELVPTVCTAGTSQWRFHAARCRGAVLICYDYAVKQLERGEMSSYSNLYVYTIDFGVLQLLLPTVS
jgi:hypothetical protein